MTVYVEALRARIAGARLERFRLGTPFVLRSVDPPLAEVVGRAVTGVQRLGKRIVIALAEERFVVIHLMIAGRLHWKKAGAKPPGKVGLAAFDFATGSLILTEAETDALLADLGRRLAAIHAAEQAALDATRTAAVI